MDNDGHRLVSNREGLGTSRFIIGYTIRDPYNQKEHFEISNILKFCGYRAYIERDTSIQKLQNLILKKYIDVRPAIHLL